MRKRSLFISIASLFLFSASAFAAPAAPDSVTLFPAKAQLTVRQALPLQPLSDNRTGVVFELPAQADPQTLRLTLKGSSVTDIDWQRVPAVDQDTVKRLRKELDDLYKEEATVDGAIKGIDARIGFWSSPSSDTASAAEMQRIDDAMSNKLGALYAQRYDHTVRLQNLKHAIKDLETRLEAATGGDSYVWRVQAAVQSKSGMVLNSASVRPVDASYSYTLAECGWTPAYRFEAVPAGEQIRFNYDASIRQSSGIDWKNAAITLATVERNITLTPPRLPSWVAHKREPVVAMEMAAAPRSAKMMIADEVRANGAPQRVEMGTFMAWELGKRTIPAGKPVSLSIASEVWTTDFVYTVRPSRDKQAYLTARVQLPEARQLPTGNALFLVDGALIDKRPFSLTGKKADLYFGSDPLVTAEMMLLDKQSGTRGFMGRSKSRTWAWDIRCTNARNFPVTLVVQEPQPQSRHNDIEVDVESAPTPEISSEEHTLTWNLSLQAGASKTISHRVTITAPEDMDIEYGRNR